MINNETIKDDINIQWISIELLQRNLKGSSCVVPGGAVFTSKDSPDPTYNLPLVLAYSILDEVLSQLIEEGKLLCPVKNGRSPLLGRKMDTAKTQLIWKNYDLVYTGKEARNDLAHKSIIAKKSDCIKFINAIKEELLSWEILSGDHQPNNTVK